jgi:LPXTG-motif cell wall-anchored protein
VSEQVKGFFNNLLAGAVWDGIKQLWGPLVLAGIVAAWQKLKHGSLDWFAILGIFVVASILGFLNFRKRNKSGTSAVEVPPPEPKLRIHRAVYGIVDKLERKCGLL